MREVDYYDALITKDLLTARALDEFEIEYIIDLVKSYLNDEVLDYKRKRNLEVVEQVNNESPLMKFIDSLNKDKVSIKRAGVAELKLLKDYGDSCIYALNTNKALREEQVVSINYGFKSLNIEARVRQPKLSLLLDSLSDERISELINESLNYKYGLELDATELGNDLSRLEEALLYEAGTRLRKFEATDYGLKIHLNFEMSHKEVIDLTSALKKLYERFKGVRYNK